MPLRPPVLPAPGLTGWLAIVTVLLVTTAISAVSIAAIGSLRALAAAEGLTRVELAVAAAREALRQGMDDLLTDARVLGERPTLKSLLASGNLELLVPYLGQYCEAATLDACAVVRAAEPLLTVGPISFAGRLPPAAELGERFLIAAAPGMSPLFGATAILSESPQTRVIVVRRIDAAFVERLGERAGMTIQVAGVTADADSAAAFALLDAEAMASQSPVTAVLAERGIYAASLAVPSGSDAAPIVVRALLPAAEVMQPVQAIARRVLSIAIAVAVLAALCGILIGRYWISGVTRLTAAANRIGAGDLSLPVPAERGSELGVLATTLEKTRLNLRELDAARRTRDSVLANISHEFRTPLAAQLASIELLKDGLGEMSLTQQHELVQSLERGARRLTRLIDNLLESVRIESGQLAIRRQEVHLADVIETARDLIEPLIRQRGQRIEVALPELPELTGDRPRLVQVVVNLLANASKFAPPDTVIGIGAARHAGGIRFWIDDEGPGPVIADDATLFQPFRRGAKDDPDESGLGLGLFIVRSIVERHGGTVALTRSGRLTRAQIDLPAAAPP